MRIAYLLIVLGLILGGGFAWQGYVRFVQPGPLAAETNVVIHRGSGFGDIAGELFRAGVISDPLAFQFGARFLGADKALRAGEYAFPARISPREALAVLQSGRTVIRRLTIAEGLTTAQVLAQLAAADGLDGKIGAEFMDTPWLKEGSLLPETYHFSFGDQRNDMLKRMAGAMAQLLTSQWQARAYGGPLKSHEEALILASIIEKETSLPNERARIAGVFINRLRKGMRLQSDPTAAYGITLGKEVLGRPLTRADLKNPTPFNTYAIDGLPPSPICNPGRESIAAALHPAETDELYFVADGAGGHVFARTLDEHNLNVARWRKITNEQRE
ncbi:MAG: aminodeoxychorismate lyase [Rhodospirillales bacterium RIFCSPLOWO2_12_FULL_58_28]|nr:MAG: aminodeoxychorismate lyase [Rhodospirillales bacterium RIFCSPLOWO2_02_FULL_58_16]OHC79967.1 MAG: aminodeoxychorismate lyase [Rhodospirillales bacterium RIFCSPLOWO2_12_FULL_58_28]